MGSAVSVSCAVDLVVWLVPAHHTVVWLVVGLGVDRIVDASLLLSFTTPGVGVLLFVLAY